MYFKNRGGTEYTKSVVPRYLALLLCLSSFCAGMFFTNRIWTAFGAKDMQNTTGNKEEKIKLASKDCALEEASKVITKKSNDILGEVSKTFHAVQTLDKTVSNLELELAAVKAAQKSVLNDSITKKDQNVAKSTNKRRYLMVVGINTAFSSRKRRDSLRSTWMPQGEKLKKLEEEKGILMRFVIGHSSTPGGILDQAIEVENRVFGDFLRLDHVEGYMELSAKTKIYFATAVALWDADFYVKVDDDVHVNIGTLAMTLAHYRSHPRVYIGCMKSGPVLFMKGVKYHEPEYWKFGDEGNEYFRHAAGQLYAISKDLADYIATNQKVLHKYANEDVSLGSWLIGLDVMHVDDRNICCGTPPDCEWKAQAGNMCAATFDWTCSGICKSSERMKDIHKRCSEGESALWSNF